MGMIEEAEKWFESNKNNNNYDSNWRDERERNFFQYYHKKQDWGNAKRFVEMAEKKDSKEGRIKRLKELSGKNYNEL